MSLIETRGYQMFPVLDPGQIETATRFASGPARQFSPGEVVYDVGEMQAPAWLVLKGTIDATEVETEVVGVVREIQNAHPNLGGILLECSMLPPYAHAVQAASGVPVYDFITMMNQLHAATHQRVYAGSY